MNSCSRAEQWSPRRSQDHEDEFEAIDQSIASATPQELARLEQPTELQQTQPINFAGAVSMAVLYHFPASTCGSLPVIFAVLSLCHHPLKAENGNYFS